MNKHILMLSAAMVALTAGSARADDWTDIVTALKVPVDTAHAANGAPGDILLGSTTSGSTTTYGSITVTTSGTQTAPQPAVTINSNNSFDAVTGTAVSNKDTDHGVGVLVNLTTQSLDATNDAGATHTVQGIVEAGTIDLSGTGGTKRGIWLEGPTTGGPFTFTGNIDMTGSTMTITGDSSDGVLIDSLTSLNGNLTLGTITMQPTSSSSTAGVIGLDVAGTVNGDIVETTAMTLTGGTSSTASGLIGLDLTGAVNGNITINSGASITVAGSGGEGIVLTGNLNACNTAVAPTCTSLGSLVNNGTISVVGLSGTSTDTTGNPVSGSALAIGGNVAGGIYNAGPFSASDTTNLAAVISAQSAVPGIEISPVFQTVATPTSITVGVYTGDTTDPGFSFYNRGTISVASSNLNQPTTTGIEIVGDTSTATATMTGGLFNTGTISVSSGSTASTASGVPVTATAITIGDFAYVGPGDTYDISSCNLSTGVCAYTGPKTADLQGDQAALVNSFESGKGMIQSSISGPMGGQAAGIVITPNGHLPSLINSGTISAVATTTDTTITILNATAIEDNSGTLTYIQNNGLISATATILDKGTQAANAIDLHNDTGNVPAASGVAIVNQATAASSARIIGNILFGTGDNQIVDVLGASTTNVATISGDIAFGGGTTFGSDKLTIGDFATVTGAVTAANGVSVDVQNGGTLVITNNTVALSAQNFHIESGGTVDLTVLANFTTGIVTAANSAVLDTGAKLDVTYGSFIPSDSNFVLISAPHGGLTVPDLSTYQTQFNQNLPFLFASADLHTLTTQDNTTDELVLTVVPKTAAQLGLTGYAAQMLPFANQALANDDVLGAAMVAGISDQKSAQQAYGQFAPDVAGGMRAIAISLTDQASGPVANRQRILRMYGKTPGEVTLWGQEFAEYIKDPGDVSAGKTGFKDHGFGFVLGLDGGEPKTGWYGGALSFYSGDIVEPAPRDSHANSLWYMLTGYTDWRGRGLFLDTNFDVGYMSMKEKRFLNLTIPSTGGGSTTFIDEADGNPPGLVGSAGFTTGVILAYGSTTLTPQFSMDGMTMREEGYTESHAGGITTAGLATGNGKGFDLHVNSYYASSLRAFLGADVREDLNLGDFFVQPGARLGYRYDFLSDPTKLKVNFADIGNLSTPTPGPQFTIEGPDPAQGNFVAGASLSATTDAWTLGANFDFVHGTNGATTEVGTIHLLGRI